MPRPWLRQFARVRWTLHLAKRFPSRREAPPRWQADTA